MQLFAFEKNKKIYVGDAVKGKNYLCSECGETVKVRGGRFRRAHYYHVRKIYCRKFSNNFLHVSIQKHLQELFGKEDCDLEVPFLKNLRIADVVWHSKKVIFEIQCSPIQLCDAKKRCEDYRSEGYEVVWILHDDLFNKKEWSSSEQFLREQTCFYVRGKGAHFRFYDQHEVIKKEKRVFRGKKYEIKIDRCKKLSLNTKFFSVPTQISNRLKNHTVFFQNDILDRYFRDRSCDILSKMKEIENISKKSLFKKFGNKTLQFIGFLTERILDKL